MAEERELVDEISDDVLHDMNDEQLTEYKNMLQQLGAHPDKIIINTLSMIAEDYSVSFPKSAEAVYGAIRDLLLSNAVAPACKVPLVYVIDSILKNVKGLYIDIMRKDIAQWMESVYKILTSSGNENARIKLRKVWNTWNEFRIFAPEDLKAIGKCFIHEDDQLAAAKKIADAKTKAAGIDRQTDGSLKISLTLRKNMQAVLDDIQADEEDELKKVSLERLADINPDLLVQIKDAAEKLEESSAPGNIAHPVALDGVEVPMMSAPPLFMDIIPEQVAKRSMEWGKLDLNFLKFTNDCTKKLNFAVRKGTSSNAQSQSTSDPNINMMNLLGSASATGSTLTQMLERYTTQNSNKGFTPFTAGPMNSNLPGALPSFYRNNMITTKIDKSKFTTEGLKEKNDSAIARLYDGGLPFVCSADGKRFASQIELSRHLDALFRKTQLEKTMERSEDRGWYIAESVWSGLALQSGDTNEGMDVDAQNNESSTDVIDPQACVVTADESRDSCAICGISFKMHFDQDDGEWKYRNCKEIEVLNDDVAEEESERMLVHATCLRGLGSPEVLTRDQVIDR